MKLNEEQAKRDRIASENSTKAKHLKDVQQQLVRLQRDQSYEIRTPEAATHVMTDRQGGVMEKLEEEKREAEVRGERSETTAKRQQKHCTTFLHN